MTRVFRGERIQRFWDGDSGAVFEDLLFENCVFDNNTISMTDDPAKRSVIRNVTMRNCLIEPGNYVGGAILEDVTFENIKISDRLLDPHGAAFRRVTLKGKIGTPLMITDYVFEGMGAEGPATKAFEKANAAFYETVDDYALDFSQAEFGDDFSIRSAIPGRLIIRNPERQLLVTNERARGLDLEELDTHLGITGWRGGIARMLARGHDSVVLCAPTRGRDLPAFDHAIAVLRERGIAEPDDLTTKT